VFLHAVVNVESAIAEVLRQGKVLPSWEPWTWELSSALSLFALTPAVFLLCRLWPVSPPRSIRNAVAHVFLSVPFSLLHVFAMVGIREAVYAAMGDNYVFGDWKLELPYEYRKDFLTYLTLVSAIHLFLYFRSRAKGDAPSGVAAAAGAAASNDASVAGDPAPLPVPERFLSRLLVPHDHREQVVTIDKVQWIEADGNYVKLHTVQGTFRPRMTLASLESRLDPGRFVRIHRSHLVSVGAVKEVQPWFHGDFRVILESGETLPLSRRFRERLKFG
jgi:hypothetical protein